MTPEQVAALSVPFPPEIIKTKGGGGKFAADYVDHGHVTERLLSVDPEWSWEPLAVDDNGLPVLAYANDHASLWGRMTVCGVTRVEVGVVAAHKDELLKEAVSDFIKRAAMRFGVALHLWMGEDAPPSKQRAKPKGKAAGSESGGVAPDGTRPQPSTGASGPAAVPDAELAKALTELGARAKTFGYDAAGVRALASEVLGRKIAKASDLTSFEDIEAVDQRLDQEAAKKEAST